MNLTTKWKPCNMQAFVNIVNLKFKLPAIRESNELEGLLHYIKLARASGLMTLLKLEGLVLVLICRCNNTGPFYPKAM